MAAHWDDAQNRYVSDCEQLPGHHDVPIGHRHTFFLHRDRATGKPKHAVVRAFRAGGFKELHTWPWDAAGLAQAQAWCDTHGALWESDRCPVRPGSLAGYADAT